jgi:hypothetical protein
MCVNLMCFSTLLIATDSRGCGDLRKGLSYFKGLAAITDSDSELQYRAIFPVSPAT